MWISSLFQTGMRKLFILGLVSSLAACGGGGGGGDKKPSPVPASSSPISSSSSSLLSSSVSSSSISSLNNSSSSSINSSIVSSLSNSSSSSISSVIVVVTDTTPDSFSFPVVTGAALSANVTSAVITISGINTAVPISIANGEYSINGGVFTSVAGTVSNGQTVVLRLLSAATVATETHAVVTIGGIAKSFSVTTTNLIGGAIQGSPLNIAGVVTTIAGAAPGADGIGVLAKFGSPTGVVSDGVFLYVADTDNHKIRKIEIVTGSVTTLAGNDLSGNADGIGGAASFRYPHGIATDGTNLYVADTSNHKIRKIVIATGLVTTLAGGGEHGGDVDGIGAAAKFELPVGITIDGAHLYVADTYNHKIRKIVIATGAVTTIAGSYSSGAADGIGTAARFDHPKAIATDGNHLYVADTYNHKIRKIVIATGLVTTLAGSGSGSNVDGTGAAASLEYPDGIVINGTHLYVTASSKIRQIETTTGAVSTIAGGGEGFADGTGTAASFRNPSGLATDGSHIYIADTGNNKIRKIEILTDVVTTLAGSTSWGSDDGAGVMASFGSPSGITTDGTHLYVTDTDNSKIRKIEVATGVVTTFAGSGEWGDADGAGAAASFNGLSGITTDGTHLYVADTYNNNIRKIVIATGLVTTLAGSGSEGSADGTGAAASFGSPRGITTDGTHLYVTDSDNHKIRKIEIATGVVTTLAGSGTEGFADGTGAAASFGSPRGITTDGTHLYVADTYNYKIRKIEIATGVVTTFAGSGSYGSADGTGAAASFRYPQGITTDGTHLYVTDSDNHKIRKIEIATGVVTTLAGSGSYGGADGVGTAAKFAYPTGITTDGFALFVSDNNTIRKID